jgi:hypothetical protein
MASGLLFGACYLCSKEGARYLGPPLWIHADRLDLDWKRLADVFLYDFAELVAL